jgi:hypothetical protein
MFQENIQAKFSFIVLAVKPLKKNRPIAFPSSDFKSI